MKLFSIRCDICTGGFFSWDHLRVLHVIRFHHTVHTEIWLDVTGRHKGSHQVHGHTPGHAPHSFQPQPDGSVWQPNTNCMYLLHKHLHQDQCPDTGGKQPTNYLTKLEERVSLDEQDHTLREQLWLQPIITPRSLSADPPPRFPPPFQSKQHLCIINML